MFEHDTWQRFWAQGFVQCPFDTNNAHKLSFAAEEAAMTTKTGIGEHGRRQQELEKQNYQPETRMHFPDVSSHRATRAPVGVHTTPCLFTPST